MEQKKGGVSSTAVAIIAILVVAAAFMAWTYPRAVLTIPVSFTLGADVARKTFEVPFMDGAVQVQVTVNSGGALWSADIQRGNSTIFTHRASQGGQTTYTSEWITLGAGTYSFNFATLGFGSLDAQVTVTAKGGLW
jgi:hypothetical protein